MGHDYQSFFKEARRAANGMSQPSPTPPRAESKVASAAVPRRRKRAQFPWLALGILCVIAAATAGYMYPHSQIARLIPIEVSMTQAGASEAASSPSEEPAKAAETKGQIQAEKAQTSPTVAMPAAADIRSLSDEELRVFAQLNERKLQLDQREAELNRLDEELQKKQTEIQEQLAKMEKVRSEISSVLKDRVEQDQEKLDKLVQVYSAMKPVQAARVIEGLNEELAIEVLNKMKKKSAADILNIMDAKKAKRLSELLAGYQSIRSPAQTENRQ